MAIAFKAAAVVPKYIDLEPNNISKALNGYIVRNTAVGNALCI